MKKVEMLAYILGAMRDGGIGVYKGHRKKDYRIYISQYKEEASEWLRLIKNLFEKLFSVHVTGPIKGVVSISRKKVFYFLLNECGVQPNGKDWLTPRWILYSPKITKRAYIRGFFDADGTFLKTKKGRIQFSQKNTKVLKELKKLLSDVGIKTGDVAHSRRIFKLSISRERDVKKFIYEIGSLHQCHLQKMFSFLGRKLDSTP